MKINVLYILSLWIFLYLALSIWFDWHNYDTSKFKTLMNFLLTTYGIMNNSTINKLIYRGKRIEVNCSAKIIYLFSQWLRNVSDRRSLCCYINADQWRRNASRSRKDNASRLIVPLSITSTRRVANRHRYNTANYRIRVSFTIEGSLAVIR